LNYKNLSSSLVIIILTVACIAIFQLTNSFADEPGPIQIGATCADINSIYHLTSNIQKTQWQLISLYALPVGSLSPDSWEMSPTFHDAFIAELQSGQTAHTYAAACTSVWQDFFSDEADVMVTLSRTITATDQILQCIDGIWVQISTQQLTNQDNSDWLTVNGSPFDVTNGSSQSLLETNLQNLIEGLNEQPGAASDPE
jgi:hypothetical protein